MSHSPVRETLLQESAGSKVRCLTCERRCLIAEGKRGWCRTRENRDGTLYTLIYGAVSSLSCNPIEKKPLYHFYPGSVALTVGSYSCNFDCPWCQNFGISKQPPSGGRSFTPAHFVDEAIIRRCSGTSISFNEPTLSLEWALEVLRLARQAGLYNTFVTNGYMTEEALERLAQAGLDGMNVDVKGSADAVRTYCQADVEVVWRNLRRAQELGIWIEITTLVIPGVNDDVTTQAEIAKRILRELGPHVPWHVTRYHPAYHFTVPPTPVRALEQALSIGRRAGLHHVYIGNVLGHDAENTYCPSCGRVLIRRQGLRSTTNRMEEGRCSDCGEEISGRGWDWREEQ